MLLCERGYFRHRGKNQVERGWRPFSQGKHWPEPACFGALGNPALQHPPVGREGGFAGPSGLKSQETTFSDELRSER